MTDKHLSHTHNNQRKNTTTEMIHQIKIKKLRQTKTKYTQAMLLFNSKCGIV